MHEHSIAAVTHKEGDRFILLVGFRSLGVGYKQVYSLSHFIQRAERLTATENLFVRSQREYRINAPAIIRPTFDKIERDKSLSCNVRVCVMTLPFASRKTIRQGFFSMVILPLAFAYVTAFPVSVPFQELSLPGSLASIRDVSSFGSTGVVNIRTRTVRGETKSIENLNSGSFT